MAQRNITWVSKDGRAFPSEELADQHDRALDLFQSASLCVTVFEYKMWLEKNKLAIGLYFKHEV